MAETETAAGLAELDRKMKREAELADALQRRLEAVRSVATSPDGEVSVEVDSSGHLCDLRIAPEAMLAGADTLAENIRCASESAQAGLPEQLSRAADDR